MNLSWQRRPAKASLSQRLNRMQKSAVKLLLFLLLSLFAAAVYGGDRFGVQATGEGGAFFTDAYANNSILRFIGNLHYSKTFHRTYFQLKMRIAPEIYEENTATSAVKSKTVLSYGGLYDTTVAWRLDANHRFYYYRLGQSGNLQYNILYLNGQCAVPRKEHASWLAQVAYFYRDISGQPYTRLDSYTVQAGIGGRFRDWVDYQLKFYAEHFIIRAVTDETGNARNEGSRIGPLVSIQYGRDYIFNASYLLVFENNKLNKKQ